MFLKMNPFDAKSEGCNTETDGDELSLTSEQHAKRVWDANHMVDNISSKINAKLCHVE